jgi:hypothetical protein
MRAYVDGRKIVIRDLGAEEARTLLNALRAAVADYRRRARVATSAAKYCLEPARGKSRAMRKRAGELELEAAGLRALARDAAALLEALSTVAADRSVI